MLDNLIYLWYNIFVVKENKERVYKAKQITIIHGGNYLCLMIMKRWLIC